MITFALWWHGEVLHHHMRKYYSWGPNSRFILVTCSCGKVWVS